MVFYPNLHTLHLDLSGEKFHLIWRQKLVEVRREMKENFVWEMEECEDGGIGILFWQKSQEINTQGTIYSSGDCYNVSEKVKE